MISYQGIPNHNGKPRKPSEKLLGNPERLGKITSATTTKGKTAYRLYCTMYRITVSVVLWLLVLNVLLLIVLLAVYNRNAGDEIFYLVLSLSGVVPVYYLWKTRWVCQTTYVGEKGLLRAKETRRGIEEEVLLFDDVFSNEHEELDYNGKRFISIWRDEKGDQLFVIKGRTTFGHLWTENEYHFFKKALEAWASWKRKKGSDS
ncbi:MAG: hypothetical protein D6806_16080 [Deltaproteobacteria bacterium]|nr:MAG: hypothetical protein D6806_16080 [Deltaproteobacteria bacterium]